MGEVTIKKIAPRRLKVEEDGFVTVTGTTSAAPMTGGGKISGTPFAGGSSGGFPSPGVKLLTTISVYVDNGNVYEYEVNSEAKAREHAASIVATGYRSVSADAPNILTWFPPSRILKVVVTLPATSTTKYFDRIKST